MQTGSVNNSSDISMIDLIHLFYRNKGLIILSTLLGMALGFAVVFYSAPTYEAKIRLTAATDGDIAELNQGRSWDRSPLKPLTVKDIHRVFNNVLLSDSAKEAFFKNYYLPALSKSQKEHRSQAQLYVSFSKNFSVVANPMTAADRFLSYNVAIRGNNPKQVVVWLNQWVQLVREQAINALLNDMKKQNDVLVSNLRHQIEIARNTAKAKRLDQVAQLKEKLHTFKLATANTSYWDDEPAVMNDASDSMPPNMDMIQAQIKSLSARKSDDAFAPNLRELQAKLEFYQSLKVKTEDVAVFHLDGVISTPDQPIAPKKRLIMMVSLVLGFMAGAFIIMFQIAWRKEKLKLANTTSGVS